MKWKKRALAALLAALCLLTACGEGGLGGDDGPVDTVEVSDAYFGMAWYQNGTLNPVLDSTSINRLLCEALYEGLFEVSGNFTAQNVLCASYAGDGTTFTFTLRDDVTFWSGEKLTAADVAASLQAAQYNEASPYHNRLTEVASIEALSGSEVRIVLSSPNINFPRLLDIPIYRQGSAESGDFADGTGPFQPVKDGNQWKLEANESWHGGFLGSIRHITLVPMTRADAAESSFRTGDVSLLREPRIAPDGASTIIGGSIDTVRTASADLHYLGVNYSNPYLANAKVRQALSAALGRQSLCDTQLQTFATPAVLPVNPQPAADGLTLNMSADTETAARLLREGLEQAGGAGDTGQDGGEADTDEEDSETDTDEDDADGEAGGTDTGSGGGDAALSIRLLVNANNTFKVAAAEQIAASWKAVGVSVTVDRQPYETYVSMLQSGDFDVYYGETLLTPDFDLRPLLSSGGSLNYGGYSSQTMSAAVAAARSGDNLAAFYTAFAEEMPFIPIAFECGQLIIRKGLIDNFSPAPYNAFAGLEEWTSSGE